MTGSTQTFPYASPGPIRLPPGNLETVEELPGDSDLEDDRFEFLCYRVIFITFHF